MKYFFNLLLSISFLVSSFALASDVDRVRLTRIRITLTEGMYVLPSDDVLQKVLAIDRLSPNGLSEEGIVRATKIVLAGKGKTLKIQSCFTCKMRILTTSGYIKIQDLKVSDEVLSWDEKKQKLVRNKVIKIHVFPDQSYGTLKSEAALNPIEVTALHRFYLPEAQAYKAISKIAAAEKLLGFKNAGSITSCEFFLGARGSYQPNSIGDVFNLTLEKEPRNYIVEGVLVHNIKMGV